MNEILRKIIITSLVLALGIFLVFLSAFLLRFLNKPWVILILIPIVVFMIGLVIKKVGIKKVRINNRELMLIAETTDSH
jgi:predicted Co/Zn/Cd cation transporter (cation efflux family)